MKQDTYHEVTRILQFTPISERLLVVQGPGLYNLTEAQLQDETYANVWTEKVVGVAIFEDWERYGWNANLKPLRFSEENGDRYHNTGMSYVMVDGDAVLKLVSTTSGVEAVLPDELHTHSELIPKIVAERKGRMQNLLVTKRQKSA